MATPPSEHQQALEVVDEHDHVIGIATRDAVHREGLLHREVHVWFVTPKGEILFQHRALDKDTYPGKLDATVGGHVDPGQTYEEAALREVMEETGLALTLGDLVLLTTHRGKSHDPVTGMTNNVIRRVYGYRFRGDRNNLRIEDGKATGFVAVPYGELRQPVGDDRIIPSLLEGDYSATYLKLFQLGTS